MLSKIGTIGEFSASIDSDDVIFEQLHAASADHSANERSAASRNGQQQTIGGTI